MNWRRGLFRLWIVCSALFVIAVATASYGLIKAEFDVATSKLEAPPPKLTKFRYRYPQYNDLSDAQVADALYKKFYSDMPRAEFDTSIGLKGAAGVPDEPNPFDKFGAIGDPPIYDPFAPTPNLWAKVAMIAGFAFGAPLVVLIIGASLVWAFSGFAAKHPR